MAKREHVERLQQGVARWNKWREQHPNIYPDLSKVDLSGADLRGADLVQANLRGACLARADLSEADLREAYLSEARLSRANLARASLMGGNLYRADLSEANLPAANLRSANLNEADLSRALLPIAKLNGAHLRDARLNEADLRVADLSESSLLQTDLRRADLSGASLNGAHLKGTYLDGARVKELRVGNTIFDWIDLRQVNGLAEMVHAFPSSVALNTIQLPADASALHFLRGAGFSDEWIAFYRTMMAHPIQYHSCFISYASQDEMLARRLHVDLQAQGVRCWFAPEDMKIGDKIRTRIDEAIHLQEKMLLLLSRHALASDWVEVEVEAALDKEREQKHEVLFPVRLDESIMQASQAWAKQLRRTRHIGDFTNWTDARSYQQAFGQLLRDLKKAIGKSGSKEVEQ